MGCGIGITTKPEAIKVEWKCQYRYFRNWKIIGTYKTLQKAQEIEKNMAYMHSCEPHECKRDPANDYGPWFVYKFDHDGKIDDS